MPKLDTPSPVIGSRWMGSSLPLLPPCSAPVGVGRGAGHRRSRHAPRCMSVSARVVCRAGPPLRPSTWDPSVPFLSLPRPFPHRFLSPRPLHAPSSFRDDGNLPMRLAANPSQFRSSSATARLETREASSLTLPGAAGGLSSWAAHHHILPRHAWHMDVVKSKASRDLASPPPTPLIALPANYRFPERAASMVNSVLSVPSGPSASHPPPCPPPTHSSRTPQPSHAATPRAQQTRTGRAATLGARATRHPLGSCPFRPLRRQGAWVSEARPTLSCLAADMTRETQQ